MPRCFQHPPHSKHCPFRGLWPGIPDAERAGIGWQPTSLGSLSKLGQEGFGTPVSSDDQKAKTQILVWLPCPICFSFLFLDIWGQILVFKTFSFFFIFNQTSTWNKINKLTSPLPLASVLFPIQHQTNCYHSFTRVGTGCGPQRLLKSFQWEWLIA